MLAKIQGMRQIIGVVGMDFTTQELKDTMDSFKFGKR